MKRFVTMRELGQMLLGWAAVMAVLFLWELLEISEVVHIMAFGIVLRPLCAAIFGVWIASRHARGVTQIDWRGVCIYLLVCVILFLTFVLYDKTLGLWWFSDRLQRLLGVDTFDQAVFDYYYHGGIRWNARWLSYWFLMLCYFDVWPWAALAAEVAVYPIAKLICIKRQSKARTGNTKQVISSTEAPAPIGIEQ
ncbi:MAG: hypothetical protein J5449_07905 [Oscillospiraceae bacterium]|nr:hypothetical protein [Oscillospiraceae bacterium]